MSAASLSDQAKDVRDDRVERLPRFVAALVIPFLLVAFGILWVNSAVASAIFAWAIKPQLTAMLLGSAYLGGVVFFSLLLAARSWHRVALGLPAVATFASLLLLTTLIHWSLFTLDRPAGVTWVAIYVVAPPLVVAAWWRNHRRDPGPAANAALMPQVVVRALLGGGAVAMALAVALYLVPSALFDVWPWKLTELSARVLAPMLCLPGIVAIGIARDRRRSAIRYPLLAQSAALVCMLASLWVRQADLTGPAASVAIAWLVLAVSLVGSLALALGLGEPAVARRRAPAYPGL
jgi:hypothetical protein